MHQQVRNLNLNFQQLTHQPNASEEYKASASPAAPAVTLFPPLFDRFRIPFFASIFFLLPDSNPPIKSTGTAMRGPDLFLAYEPSDPFLLGGLFLDAAAIPTSFASLISPQPSSESASCLWKRELGVAVAWKKKRISRRILVNRFLSISLSVEEDDDDGVGGVDRERIELVARSGLMQMEKKSGASAFNTTKHLWAGAVAAMVSRTFVAPLERLKLEYIVRGEQRNLLELIKTIAVTQGIQGFWKGNVVNILRTAPFKAINFYAYDLYRSQLMKLSGSDEATNFERFVAGAAAGITATLLCLPMDTIRTVMIAPGGEALGGVIGTFRHMVQTEGFFSLYKGLVPSIISMAPSGAVFYGVYDILKSAYLHSPEGMIRVQNLKQEGQELNALEQLELGTLRTLFYGAIAGACSEAATYPFEVVRRQLQMQPQAFKLSALATCMKVVEQGGIPALYAGLTPSLLQVLPSAAISYFVYEFMKIVLKVEAA